MGVSEDKVMQLLAQAGLAHQQQLQALKDERDTEKAILLAELEDMRRGGGSGRAASPSKQLRKSGTTKGQQKNDRSPVPSELEEVKTLSRQDSRSLTRQGSQRFNMAWSYEIDTDPMLHEGSHDSRMKSDRSTQPASGRNISLSFLNSQEPEPPGAPTRMDNFMEEAGSLRAPGVEEQELSVSHHTYKSRNSQYDGSQQGGKMRSSIRTSVRSERPAELDLPKVPDLCDVWEAGRTTSKARVNFASRKRAPIRSGMLQTATPMERFFQQGRGRFISYMVLQPHCSRRLVYEVFGLLLICYDLIWLPVEAFDPENTTFAEAMAWITSIYWLLDIPASFLVGYAILEEGTVEMRITKIARRYLRTWFFFDLIIVGVDWGLQIWTLLLLTQQDSGAEAGVAFFRMAKTIRLLRFLRLLRLLKARGRINDLVEQIQSEASLILIGILKMLVFIVTVNHLVACVWYAIGNYDASRQDRWIVEYKVEMKNLLYRYSTALHWSITQFTPASMEVFPQNEYERLFTVCIILSGMLIFSSFVSAITNAMNQLRNLNSWRHEQESLLRRYLRENLVTPSLTARIHNCLNKAMKQSRRRVHEDEINILQLLPLSLKFELSNEIYAPALGKHPFFTFCYSCLPAESRKIYSHAVAQKSLVISQELITTGEAGKHMYFLVSGTLIYTRDDDEHQAITTTQPWLVEPALWLKWQHVGTASSSSQSELVCLDALKVQDILKEEVTVRTYAKKFWRYFREAPEMLSDIWIDEEHVYSWAASAMSMAEEILGTVIQPEPLSPNFTRFLNGLRRMSNGMLHRFSIVSYVSQNSGNGTGPGKLPPQLQELVERMQLARQEQEAESRSSSSGLDDSDSDREAPRTNRHGSICHVVPAQPH